MIHQHFYIVRRMAHKMVLGMNFLNKTQATIKCGKIFQIWVEYPESGRRFNEKIGEPRPGTSREICQMTKKKINNKGGKQGEGE